MKSGLISSLQGTEAESGDGGMRVNREMFGPKRRMNYCWLGTEVLTQISLTFRTYLSLVFSFAAL
jgi:hypothetical protein